MMAYLLPDGTIHAPMVERLEDGTTVDGYEDLHPGDKGYQDWLPFAHPMKEAKGNGNGGNGKASAEKQRDLSLWQKKALKRLSEGRRAGCPFESPHLPEVVLNRVGRALNDCKTADDVRRVFEEAMLPDREPAAGHVAPIYVLSHGGTAYTAHQNADDRITGWLDPPLTPEGRMEAREFGRRLKNLGIDRIQTSDLIRAFETARIVGEVLEIGAPQPTRELRPWNLGDWQGDATESRMPQIVEAIRATPGEPVPGGEAFDTFRTRLLSRVQAAMNEQEYGGRGALLLVSHSRCVELIRAWLLSQAADGDLKEALHFELDAIPRGCALMLSCGPTGWVASAWDAVWDTRLPAPTGERMAGTRSPKAAIGATWRRRAEQHEAVFGKPHAPEGE